MDILSLINRNIEEIGANSIFEKYFSLTPLQEGINVYCLLNEILGIDLILDENYKVKSIHFYSGKQQGICKFNDKLPFELNFSFIRNKTKQLLGEPDRSGRGDFSFLYGITPSWDKYLFEKFSLHLQFSEKDTEIDLITIDALLLV